MVNSDMANKTEQKLSGLQIAKMVQNRAGQTAISTKGSTKANARQRITPEMKDALRRAVRSVKQMADNLRDPQYLKQIDERLALMSSDPMRLYQSAGRTLDSFPLGMQYARAEVIGDSEQTEMMRVLDDVSSTAAGQIGESSGQAVNGSSTMDTLQNIASGIIQTTGDVASSILGNVAEKLSQALQSSENVESSQQQDGGEGGGGSDGGGQGQGDGQGEASQQQVNVSVGITITSDKADEIADAVAKMAGGALTMVESAMSKGIATLKALTSKVGQGNGARDLLQTSIQKALDQKVAKMMAPIMGYVKTAHSISHPLFESIFMMTWTENGQWQPEFGGAQSEWMKCAKELVEFFDFIQKVMGGAIAEVTKGLDKMFDNVCKVGQMALEGKVSVSAIIQLPDLSVPLMSISKQIQEVMNKIMVLKEIVRQMAKQVIGKLKSLEAPALYLKKPKEFELIMDLLIEIEFIYANLSTVMDKIIEFFLNLMVEEFAKLAEEIIDKVFDIWEKVIEIVPPLEDLLNMCWAVPNQADLCCNIALNIALPQMWSIISPFIELPFECIKMVSDACDAATELAYAVPPP